MTNLRNNKVMLMISIVLIISIILNGVLYMHLLTQQKDIEAKQATKIEKKDSEITELKGKVDELNTVISSKKPEDKKQLSQTELEKQEQYKSVATEFVSAYLDYDTDKLEERRKKLSMITNDKLLNRLAPKQSDSTDNELSSDPTFTSKVTDATVYLTGINEIDNEMKAIIDVTYIAKNTEGKSKLKNYISIDMEMDDHGTIRVVNYAYYPID